MGDLERHTLFSRFKKQERKKYQEIENASMIKTERETTAENEDHLQELQKQFALLDLDPFIAQLRGDLHAIKETMEPFERTKNEIGLDVWRFNLAVPGEWFDQDTAIRAATGMAFQLYYERPDLNRPEDIDDFGLYTARDEPYFDSSNPTFIILLHYPSQQLITTADGKDLADVSPAHIFIGTDSTESIYQGGLLESFGINQAARERDKARFKHSSDEYDRFLHSARMAAREKFEGVKPWRREPFVWNQEINEIRDGGQIASLNDIFGIKIEKTKPRFRRKVDARVVKGSGREGSEIFFPSNTGVVRNQIDQKIWEFLRTQPMYAPYLESPFPEDV